jgi:hypothetical protein
MGNHRLFFYSSKKIRMNLYDASDQHFWSGEKVAVCIGGITIIFEWRSSLRRLLLYFLGERWWWAIWGNLLFILIDHLYKWLFFPPPLGWGIFFKPLHAWAVDQTRRGKKVITEKEGSRLHNNMVNNIFQDGRNSGQKMEKHLVPHWWILLIIDGVFCVMPGKYVYVMVGCNVGVATKSTPLK